MEYSILVLKQAVIMVLISVIGMICYKSNIITKQVQKYFSALVLKVVIPSFVIMSFQVELSGELIKGMVMALILSILSHLIMILLSNIVIRKNDKIEYAIERFSLVYTNCGFMGIPLIEGVLGTEGALYATIYLTVFNVLAWSHGLIIVKNEFSAKELVGVFKTPTMISIGVGILLLVFGIKLPEIVARPLQYVASMNTPLPMLIAGVMIAQQPFLDTIKDMRAVFISILKQLVFPIIVFLIIRQIPCSDVVLMSVVLSVACPTAALGTLLAIEYNKNATYASRIFAITTVASSITMPLVILFVNMFN